MITAARGTLDPIDGVEFVPAVDLLKRLQAASGGTIEEARPVQSASVRIGSVAPSW